MSQEIIDVEARPLAVRDSIEPQQNVALFGTSDPVAVIANATRVADALKAMIVKKKLVANIQGKEYPQVEAWQTLAVMLGLAAVCEWSRPVEGGWEARVIVQRNGLTIAAAEAQCLKSERTKKGWEDYAIRSMAQTRATSKSLRSVLGFVMVLAGYEATPAEEMPTPEPKAATPQERTVESAVPSPRDISILAKNRGLSDAEYRSLLDYLFPAQEWSKGKPSAADLDAEQRRAAYRAVAELTQAQGGVE